MTPDRVAPQGTVYGLLVALRSPRKPRQHPGNALNMTVRHHSAGKSLRMPREVCVTRVDVHPVCCPILRPRFPVVLPRDRARSFSPMDRVQKPVPLSTSRRVPASLGFETPRERSFPYADADRPCLPHLCGHLRIAFLATDTPVSVVIAHHLINDPAHILFQVRLPEVAVRSCLPPACIPPGRTARRRANRCRADRRRKIAPSTAS